MEEYLVECDIVDYSNSSIQALSKKLSLYCKNEEEIVKKCFLYVRDEIKHLGDFPSDTKTCKASEVLKKKTGLCYAKSHLLCALLRANNIPTAFCYQRLSCDEYKKDIFCLHGLNAVYLEKYGWYRIDARGNKKGVDAQFNPPYENLAFPLQDGETDIEGLFAKPLDCIVQHLNKYEKFEDIVGKLPDRIDFKV